MVNERAKWDWENKTVKKRLIFSNNKKRVYKLGNVKKHIKVKNGETISIGKTVASTNYILVDKKGKTLNASNDLHFLKTRMDKE